MTMPRKTKERILNRANLSELEAALKTAEDEGAIYSALSDLCWYNNHEGQTCPSQQKQRETNLCDNLVAVRHVFIEVSNRWKRVATEAAEFRIDYPDDEKTTISVSTDPISPEERAAVKIVDGELVVWLPMVFNTPTEKKLLWVAALPDGQQSDGGQQFAPVQPYVAVSSHEIQQVWRFVSHLPHPLAPIVTALQELELPQSAEPDRRKTGIAPGVLKHTTLHSLNRSSSENRHGQIPLELSPVSVGETRHSIQAELPFLETPKSSQLVPALPLAIYDHAGGALQRRGGGAPIALRLFFEALMTVPREGRDLHQSAELTVTLRELVAWLWPNGWQRNRDLPGLAWGLKDLGELRVDWERRLWNLVVARTLPTWDTKLDDPIVFHVFNLPGSDRGPSIDRIELRYWGLKSAPAYRAYLRLAYLWDDIKAKRGGRRLYATRPEVLRNDQGQLVDAQSKLILERGQPVTRWDHPHAVQTGRLERNPAADNVDTLGPEDLALLGFDDNPTLTSEQIRDRAKLTRKALHRMQKQGAVVLEKDGYGGLRILEPAPRNRKEDGATN